MIKQRIRYASIPVIPDNCLWALFINGDNSTVTDLSINNHTGNVTDVACNMQSEPVFNNDTSIIDITNTNYAVAPTEYTIEAYFRPIFTNQSFSERDFIVSHKSGTAGVAIECRGYLSTKCIVDININGSSFGSDCFYNIWTYVVIKRTITGYYLYVNGIEKYNDLNLVESWPDVNYKIGQNFGGAIQWTAMYTGAWTAEQILDRYNNSFINDGRIKKCGWNTKSNLYIHRNTWNKANIIQVYRDGNWI